MKQTYQVGMDSNQLSFSALINTQGVAYTSVYLHTVGVNPDPKLKESNEDSGNIPEFQAGTAAELKGKYIIFKTLIDLVSVDKSLWEQAKNNLKASYFADGGAGGSQKFHPSEEDILTSPGGKLISITQIIELI